MAKIKFTAIVAQMSGKLSGTVFSHNRGGNYVRTRVKPSNPKTSYQSVARNAFSFNTKQWGKIPNPDRILWNNAVGDFLKRNVLGDTHKLSGKALYQSLNNNLVHVGETPIDTPPLAHAVNTFDTLSVACSATGSTMTIDFTPAIDTGDKVILQATAAVSPGTFNFTNKYRKIGILDSTFLTAASIKTMYTAKFGSVPAIGEKVGVRVKVVTKATGIASPWFSAETTSV